MRTAWQYAIHKLHITPPVSRPMFYTEDTGEMAEEGFNHMNKDINNEKVTAVNENALKMKLENNPVFKSFEEAKDVDDLYRIAEIWVNPSYND